MADVSIHDLIKWCRSTTDGSFPCRDNQIAIALREVASLKDKNSLGQLCDAMVDAVVRLNPDEQYETNVRDARETLAILALYADHHYDSPDKWAELELVKAYKYLEYYGPAMKLVKEIYADKRINLIGDVFKDTSFCQALN